MAHPDSFHARSVLHVGDRRFEIFRLSAVTGSERLPYTVKILLENVLRHEDAKSVTGADIETVARWSAASTPSRAPEPKEIPFSPERVLMQDFTGVPAVVDLAAMRDALRALGGDPSRVDPLVPCELVIDHSVIAERSGGPRAFEDNVAIEYERNLERYQLLRWAQQSFEQFQVVPPGTGICHQVNLEYLARVVFQTDDGDAFPDTIVGTDSHTTMVNGLGVLGWGVGGIEAEAAMLGQPLSMLLPPVVGLHLHGEMPEGTTATDLVLTITQLLRRHGVVGKFVEAYGPGVASLPVETRATIGNMSPEYGATCTVFPIDRATIDYLRFTGRDEEHLALVEAYAKEQGLWHDPSAPDPEHTETVDLDLGTVEPSLAGPSRPQDRVSLAGAGKAFRAALGRDVRAGPAAGAAGETGAASAEGAASGEGAGAASGTSGGSAEEPPRPLTDGDVVIAAITSCTNTSNPQVLVAAGLVAKKAVARGLMTKPWVKTSLAPGSRVVMDYLEKAGLVEPLEKLGFWLVGFGCTTCIGNSGPLLPGVSEEVQARDLSVVSVLSGNRNFEGRIHPDVRMNYLASPPLVVAYAIAGTMDIDLTVDPIGTDQEGKPVMLSELWPSSHEVASTIRSSLTSEEFRVRYSSVFEGDERWRSMEVAGGETFAWDDRSTYVLHPPYFEGIGIEPEPLAGIDDARVLVMLGDSVTTDHISPAGSIRPTSPAGEYLLAHGVDRQDFNSYGARRGNHEVMVRGTFANVRLRNQLVPGIEGGVTVHLPDGEQTTIYEAAQRYRAEGVPLLVLAGKEYGSGSSRDWAAKGPRLLGVRAVIAQSYERIHRSNLIGMGILPLQFRDGESASSLGLTGRERFSIDGVAELGEGSIGDELEVRATADDGTTTKFGARVRIDTPMEVEYYRHGGILQYVLRQLAR
ncbi:MAG: aconitate hydratase AcnA [Actinomycetota bacterium]|nr:aconitate hydratase AcnA [Actinomycetota bacterium]